MDKTEYNDAIKMIAEGIKTIKRIKGVSCDMDLSDEVDKVISLLELVNEDWNHDIEALTNLMTKYRLKAVILSPEEEKDCWLKICWLIHKLADLNVFVNYTEPTLMILEQISIDIKSEGKNKNN